MIKLKLLRWEDYMELSGGGAVLNVIPRVLVRWRQKFREGKRFYVADFEDGDRSYEPREVDNL